MLALDHGSLLVSPLWVQQCSAYFYVSYFPDLMIDRQLRDEHQVWEDWKKYCDFYHIEFLKKV